MSVLLAGTRRSVPLIDVSQNGGYTVAMLCQNDLCAFCNTSRETIDHLFFIVFTPLHFGMNLNLIGSL